MISAQRGRAGDGSAAIVKVENLVKSYDGGRTKAVDGVSFEVKEGEVFGFLGPNGAGKSTTINMLTTLLPVTSGKAEVCGFDVHRHPNEVRRSVGVVPQDYTADEDMTGMQNILLCGDLYGLPRSDSKRHARGAPRARRAPGRGEEECEHLLRRDAEEAWNSPAA